MIEIEKEKQNGESILSIKNFSVNFDTYDGTVHALDDINIELVEGESLGILGESGSGKSTLATAIMGLLPSNAHVSGSISFRGNEYINSTTVNPPRKKLSRSQIKMLSINLRNMRWKNISMVFQGAMNSFNPVYTIEKQIKEVYKIHTDLSDDEIDKRVVETIKYAGLNPAVLKAYPHELSGGMKQRAVIAMALALNPDIVIADEPTTGLDVITQAEIISQLKKLKSEGKIKNLIIISHDIGVISQLADHVAVLYAGKIMEYGTARDIYINSRNPYSIELLRSYPSIKNARKTVHGIPGSLPDPINVPKGCRFYERCPYSSDVCGQSEPPIVTIDDVHYSRCFFANELKKHESNINEDYENNIKFGEDVLNVNDLVTYFSLKKSLSGKLFSRNDLFVRAVDHVSINIRQGEILGIVGESGSGKTTFARTIIDLIKPTAGDIVYIFDNKKIDITKIENKDDYSLFRRSTQMIFQDPYDSLNPKMTVFDIISEPIIAHRITKDPDEMVKMVKNILKTVSLTPPENYLERYPHELSGGERQRVATARALVLGGVKFLVADEPTSMLDVSLRAGFMNLLKEIRNKTNLSVLYISHDIASVYYLSDYIMVMYLGVAVEYGKASDIINNPEHPYTRALIRAVPVPTPDWNPGNIGIMGEIGNAINVPKGCRFYERCLYREVKCKYEKPEYQRIGDHWYLCHFSPEELDSKINWSQRDLKMIISPMIR
ncbi:ABC transporter ATP-binding protein [Picrophilus oshimae]|uniref:Peptide/nickel transport system ATP-binding protein n=1 Tax=Picrophilus torridus (strain ATCC 700027 / DSM 9790 / JCM 10055 / NBRC 100828 / KAW 2/3) TaxID=1122961 RepID=A0A8G2FVT5_PICTO|nr:ABC transporter ATP-binding protein [Picrophilus oshimae]SMD30425.1 peptide/nickel transport system ATP-binding protein [Picrophilus oshimae DSM 9789]